MESQQEYTGKLWVMRTDGRLEPVAIPDDADFEGVHAHRLLFLLRSDWKVNGTLHRVGSLLAVNWQDLAYLRPEVVYTPEDRILFAVHNVRKNVRNPRVFFYTSTKDDRVHPGHARKWWPKWRIRDTSALFENIEGGSRKPARTGCSRIGAISIFSSKNEPGEKIKFSYEMSLKAGAKRSAAGPPFCFE